MFMLRRHAAPVEGHSGPSSAGTGGAGGSGSAGLGGGSGGQRDFDGVGARGHTGGGIQLPGGVL